MPQINRYRVDITLRVTEGFYETPDEAVAAATAKLNITDPARIVRVEVRKED